jgi:sorting nexin-1/2
MQLDAEENEDIFYKPPVEPAARATSERLSGETAAEVESASVMTADTEESED